MIQAAFIFLITWGAFRLTGNEMASGVANGMYSLPTLLSILFAGVLTDKLSHKKILIFINIVRCVALFSMALLVYAQILKIEHIYIASFVMGIANAFNIPANRAILPNIVDNIDIIHANALIASVAGGSLVFGAIIGNELIQIMSTFSTYFLLGVLCVIGLISLCFIKQPDIYLNRKPHSIVQSWMELSDGFKFVKTIPWLWITISLFLIINVSVYGPWNIGLPILGDVLLDEGLVGLRYIYIFSGIGVAVTTLTIGQLEKLKKPGWFLYIAIILQGFALLFIGSTNIIGVALIGGFLMGIGATTFSTVWFSLLQEQVPKDKLGRVASIDYLGSWLLAPIGFSITGYIGKSYGVEVVFILGGFITLVLAILALSQAPIRNLK